QAPELCVGERHLVVVRIRSTLFWSAVRRMRIEEMDPAEPGRRSLLVAGCWGLIAGGWLLGTGRSRSAPRENPIACELNDVLGRSLGEGERDRTGLAADAVVVDVEAAAQTDARVENERADECAGAVP